MGHAPRRGPGKGVWVHQDLHTMGWQSADALEGRQVACMVEASHCKHTGAVAGSSAARAPCFASPSRCNALCLALFIASCHAMRYVMQEVLKVYLKYTEVIVSVESGR